MTLCSPSPPHLRNFEKRAWAVFSDGDIPPERVAHAALQSSSYPANPHNSPEEPAKVALFGIKRLTRTSDKPNGGNPYDHTAQPGYVGISRTCSTQSEGPIRLRKHHLRRRGICCCGSGKADRTAGVIGRVFSQPPGFAVDRAHHF